MRLLTLIIFFTAAGSAMYAQCETWNNSPKQEDAENAHVVYRQYVKNKDYDAAFEQWQIAYDIAPAADGRRDAHYKDGIAIYRDKLQKATDDAQKEEYKNMMLSLYDQVAQCIGDGAITYKGCTEDACRQKRIGVMKGQQAVDMYYYIQKPRAETYEVFKESVQLAGNSSEYTVLKPYTDIIVYLYLNERITAVEARAGIAALTEIADYNIANNERYATYYEYEKALMMGEVAKIEKSIYDCEYFVEKLTPRYEENPQDVDNLTYIIATLKRQGCESGQAFLDQVEAEYGVIAADINAQKQAEFEANNPAVVAKNCYDTGDFDCAIDKYNEAIEKEENPEQKAQYYFAIASIQFRKQDKYGAARSTAYEAAKMKDGWGRPYMLIGDMYAKASRTCGNDAYTRGLAILAAIDKWSYAKSVDGAVADEANRNIARFSQYLPPKDDAFMMGKKEGEQETVGCWIGEKVKLRFK